MDRMWYKDFSIRKQHNKKVLEQFETMKGVKKCQKD